MKTPKFPILFTLIGAILLSGIFGFMASNVFVSQGYLVNPLIPWAIVFATFFISKRDTNLAFTSSLDLSALPAKMKDYCIENMVGLLTKLMLGIRPAYFNLLMNVKDEIPLVELVVDSIVQPGGKDTFDPQNNKIKFKARIGKVRSCKVDLQFKPTQVLNMWRSYLGMIAGGSIKVDEMPFESFIVQKIIERAKDDVRVLALFKGVYNASGTTASDLFNGVLKIVVDEISSGGIPAGNIAAGAAITSSNAYDQVQLVVDKVYADPRYNSVPMVCLLAPENYRFYCQDYAATRGAAPYNDNFNQTLIEGTNITLIAEPSMSGSDRIIITPEANLYYLVDEEAATNNITIEYALRNINVMMDFSIAPEIGIAELIWTNDQA
jgi:hypothetical protein